MMSLPFMIGTKLIIWAAEITVDFAVSSCLTEFII